MNVCHTIQIGTESLVGEGVTLGEKVSIKWSVIGSHCKIGERAKVTNCVIMDHVVIENGLVQNVFNVVSFWEQ